MTTETTAMLFRLGTPDDAAAIMRVHRESILELGTKSYSLAEAESWAAGLVAERYVTAMAEGGETFLVAEGDGAGVVAFCSYKEDEVCGLYVAPSAARSGVGSALLRRAEAAIAAAGHRRVRIGASLSGEAFYARHGYGVVLRRGWKTRGGLTIPVVDMEKTVADP